MPKKKRFARIAITLPEQDLAAADRLAKAQDRSRSWIVAEAIRRYVEADGSASSANSRIAASRPARETPVAGGLGDSRHQQLVRDLALTPEQRVREAEETTRLSERRSGPRSNQLLAFDRYEDFLDWKRNRGVLR